MKSINMRSTSKNYKKYAHNAIATSPLTKIDSQISTSSSKPKTVHSLTSSTNKAAKLIVKISGSLSDSNKLNLTFDTHHMIIEIKCKNNESL